LRALPGAITSALCWSHARRQFFELADIAANARRGKKAPVPCFACGQRVGVAMALNDEIGTLLANALYLGGRGDIRNKNFRITSSLHHALMDRLRLSNATQRKIEQIQNAATCAGLVPTDRAGPRRN